MRWSRDLFGASYVPWCWWVLFLCLQALPQMNLAAHWGDSTGQRFRASDRGVLVLGSCIMFSYLGWVAAQVTGLGPGLSICSPGGLISVHHGAWSLARWCVLIYTLLGGMWSVAMTDFVQMIVLGVGLAGDLPGLLRTWQVAQARWWNCGQHARASSSSSPAAESEDLDVLLLLPPSP